jgi:hypothetical protein
MHLRIARSTRSEPREAVAEAARAAVARCRSPALALVFSTFEYAAEDLAEALNEELGTFPWAGAVTPAILHGREVLRRGLAIGVIDSELVRVRIGVAGPLSAGARSAGRRAALEALKNMPLPPADRSRAMIVFADTTGCDAAEMVHGALGVGGAGIAWGGGATGDGNADGPATQFTNRRAFRDHVIAITIDCHARVGTGVQHGWKPTGAPAMVTRATGAVVECLEHRPALEIYRTAVEAGGEYVDLLELAEFARTRPLGIPQAEGEFLIRDLLAVDKAGALRFMAGVPDGALVRVMEGTPTMLVEAARCAAAMAREDAGGVPLGGALVFDCVSRAHVLGDRLQDELAASQAALGDDVPMLGCLTFGEVGAFGARIPQFHNKTMVVMALPA